MTGLDRAVSVLAEARSILVFTGAGISTESGIPDFRGPDGLWTKVDPDDFNISRYLTNRELRVQKWRMHADGELWGARSHVRPNRGHMAIVELHRAGRLAGCVTQNIDGLHLVSGLPESRVAELHGDVRKVTCLGCRREWPIGEVLDRVDAGEDDPDCTDCGGMLKTSTVMFGEILPESEMEKAAAFAAAADAVLAVGSTMGVFPAAHIPIGMALDAKPLVIVNQGPTEADYLATVRLEGAAGDLLPPLVGALVGR
ncbi:MAG: SIR2 family NAD-dependent protein deacylase [Acidimicrobiia bacterium]